MTNNEATLLSTETLTPSHSPVMSTSASNDCLQLSAEKDTGAVEYKWKLLNKSAERVSHLTTQLAYRLSEGAGSCLYELGVLDSGFPEGLSEPDLKSTYELIQRMARSVGAEARLSQVANGRCGWVAEVVVERTGHVLTDGRDLHVTLIGQAHVGKSTLLGVLCTGKLDNGHGSARMHVFTHRHEVESGHTQTVSRQLVGFDKHGTITNHKTAANAATAFNEHAWHSIAQDAVTLISFYDCVGAASGQRITLAALLTHGIDYAMFAIDGTVGVSELDREHLATCVALELPIIMVITKADLCSPLQLQCARDTIQEAVTDAYALNFPTRSSRCIIVEDETAFQCCLPLLTTADAVPVFTVSAHTGLCVDLFSSFLFRLPKVKDWTLAERCALEFSVDSVYEIDDSSILGGTLLSGSMEIGQRIQLGPLGTASRFVTAKVTSIHIKRQAARRAKAGQVASIAIQPDEKLLHSDLRRGLVALDVDACVDPHVTRTFTARMRLESNINSLIVGAEPVVCLTNIRQSALVLGFSTTPPSVSECCSSPTLCNEIDVELQFCHTPEFLRPGTRCFLSEAGIKAKGIVTVVKGDLIETETPRRRAKRTGKRRKNSNEESPCEEDPSLLTLSAHTLPSRPKTAPLDLCSLQELNESRSLVRPDLHSPSHSMHSPIFSLLSHEHGAS